MIISGIEIVIKYEILHYGDYIVIVMTVQSLEDVCKVQLC